MKRIAFAAVAVTLLVTLPAVAKRRPTAEQPSHGRRAAQRGLDFLAKSTPAWQAQHKCYGCHVQAVTMQAISTAVRNDYGVTREFVDDVLAGLTTVKGGVRSQHGLSHSGGSEAGEAKAYGGSALAVFDQYVSNRATDDLLTAARRLLEHQQDDGSVHTDVARFPVSPSTIHTTYRAVQTWRQAYARSADDAWRAPLRRGEEYLSRKAEELLAAEAKASLLDLNFVALGLVEAGVGASEAHPAAIAQILRARQRDDGAWAFTKRSPAQPSPYATGQTLYTLRMLGVGEGDSAIARGTRWLVKNQRDDGAWSSGGTAKAEAMWAVLGLVSIDVVGLDIAGVRDGDRVDGQRTFTAVATDNHGTAVDKIEVFVDDVLVHTAKGDRARFTLDAKKLELGPNLVDVVATNRAKKSGRRRFTVYAGDYYLTDVGSRFEAGATSIGLRNLGGPGAKVRLQVLDQDKVVHTSVQPSKSGAMRFVFTPKKDPGADTTYTARLAYVAKDRTLQTVEHSFVHASAAAQRRRYGDVQGQLTSGEKSLANTWIELVDDEGRVVRRTRSTRSGQYRFKNIDQGKYKVRINKRGYESWENEVDVQRGTEAANDVDL